MPPNLLHIHNARIWTGDPKRQWASSITMDRGRIQSLDSGPERSLHSIDALGRTIVPGLIDAHMHLLMGGKSLSELDLSQVRSRTEFETKLAQQHATLPPEQWLIARGWSQENWGGEIPHKGWLAAVGDRPTICYRMDMHVALVNDAVLRLSDLTKPISGGRVDRDPITGEPTGLMIEAAAWHLINPLVPTPSPDEQRQQLLAAQAYAHSLGLTALGSMEYALDVHRVFAPLRDQLTLRCRITLLDREWPDPSSPFDVSFARNFHNDDRLAIIGYKAFIDGTLGSRTARMLQDYSDDPGNRGMLVELAQQGVLHDWACSVAAAGLSPSMHAIGDEAVRLALDAADAVDAAGSPQRCRIEHAQQIDPADIPRFRNRIASMQPLHKADDCRYVRSRVGEHRLAGTFAFRSLLDAGAVLAFGSDWPVVSPDPMLGMRTAITGVLLNGEVFGLQENLTVEQSLQAYTSAAAYALGINDAGVLREGALGDLVMFDRDPFEADWISSPPRIIMTVVAGRVVYDAQSH